MLSQCNRAMAKSSFAAGSASATASPRDALARLNSDRSLDATLVSKAAGE